MPILDATIKSHGKPFILFNASQTLREALKGLKESGLASNEAYLIVEVGTGERVNYTVESFLRVVSIARLMDYESLDTALGMLPFRAASRVVPSDTTERANDVLLWVQSNPRSRLLVTRDGIVVGLFASVELSSSGYFDRPGMSVLWGDLIDLTIDDRAVWEETVVPAPCPGCATRKRFRREALELICQNPNCGYRINLL